MCGLCGSACQYCSVFGALKFAKCVYPLTSLHVMRSPRPFLATLKDCKQLKSEVREGLGARLCILGAMYTSNPACCQDYAVCHFLRLLQYLQSLVTSCCSWSIYDTVIAQRHSAGSSAKVCVPWLAFSRAKRRSAAELKEARVECAGWLYTQALQGWKA